MDSRDGHFNAAAGRRSRARGVVALAVISLAAAGCGAPEEAGSSAAMVDTAGGATTHDGRVPLATAWHLTIELPGDTIPQLVRGHAARCIEAGPALCRVEMATAGFRNDRHDRYANGRLVVLADPGWLIGFRQQLQNDLDLAEGRSISESVAMSNVADRLNASDETLAAMPLDTAQRRQAERERQILEERVTLQALDVSYQPILGPLDNQGARAVQTVLAMGTNLLGYGLATALALVLVGIPLALARWAFVRRRRTPAPEPG